MVNPSSTLLQPTNGTSTPNGIIRSNADSPATPASTSAPSRPEKAAKPAPRLSIEATVEQLSAALGEKWDEYGRELNLFIMGKRTRMELQDMLDQVLTDASLKKLHNNLLMGILANASRDPPPVSGSFLGWNRNKKRKEPMTARTRSQGKQKRLKTEIMGLGPRERNRIKSFKAINELDPVSPTKIMLISQNEKKLYPPIPGAILESRRAKYSPKLPKDKNFQMTNTIQLEITKGINVPLASETLELPSTDDILDRARGMAYDYQLSHAVGQNVAELVLAGLEV
jgi:transcriptional coactivator HFI1/ADA1